MSWKKKFPQLAGMISPESQPTAPAPSMGMPASLPKLPGLPDPSSSAMATPGVHEAVKKRALMNIAMGKKGF